MTPEERAERRQRELQRIRRMGFEDGQKMPPLPEETKQKLARLMWPPEIPKRRMQ